MKIVFYNNNIAKIFRTITGNEVFSIGPVVITSLNESEISLGSYNHYVTHCRQWTEVTIVSFLAMISINGVYSVASTAILSMLMYYLIYLIEMLIRLVTNSDSSVSFETESKLSELDPTYTEKFHLFEWVKYLFKN